MKARRRVVVAMVSVVLGALAASGAAFAGDSPGQRGDRPARDGRVLCERLEAKIQHVRATIGHLEALADRIEQKIATGELTAEQEARARKVLEKIGNAQERLGEKLEKLLARYGEKCAA